MRHLFAKGAFSTHLCVIAGLVVLAASLLHSNLRGDWPYPRSIIEREAPSGLAGTVSVVTGANSGVGFETARALAEGGSTVVLACRSQKRCEGAAADILESAAQKGQKVQVLSATCDLEDPQSIHAFAMRISRDFARIDFLILNAGVTGIGWLHVSRTYQGIEKRFAVNHVGHHYLTKLLLPRLIANGTIGRSRVVVVSSRSHKFSPAWTVPIKNGLPTTVMLEASPQIFPFMRDLRLYGFSKFCNVLFAQELHRRWGQYLVAVSLHPGSSMNTGGGQSGLLRRLWLKVVSPWTKDVLQGASTSIWGALSASVTGGEYLSDCKVSRDIHPDAESNAHGAALWDYTEELIAAWPVMN